MRANLATRWRSCLVLCAAAAAASCTAGSDGSASTSLSYDARSVAHAQGAVQTAAARPAATAGTATSAPAQPATPPPSAAAAPSASPAPPLSPSQARVAQVLAYDDKDPLADLEKADELDRSVGKGPAKNVKPPARGCVLEEEPRRVWSEPGIANVAALGTGFVIAGYAQNASGERLFVLHLPSSGLPEPVATLHVEPPHPTPRAAPPGLIADAAQGGATLVYSDGAGVLFMERLQVGSTHGAGDKRELSRGVDTRFMPALTYGQRGPLIAFTLGTTPMRTMLLRIGARGELLSTHDVTPDAMGAAAPAFVSGAAPPLLVTADARNGMSPIARTRLAFDGKPQAPEVAVPVGMMSQPPQLTAAESSFGAFVGYTGLGSASTSAVGLVQILPKAGAPSALIKGTAYGPLHVAAVAQASSVLFVADAPTSPGKSPAHELQLVRIDEKGQGPVLHIAGPGGDARQVAMARGEQGRVALVFTGKDGVYFTSARCAD